MAKRVRFSGFLLLLALSLSMDYSSQLQPSQHQALLRIQQLLYYPSVMSSFDNGTDFCQIEPTPSLTIACYEDNVTQLHIIGRNKVPPLPQNFSMEAFFDALASLTGLKVLSLVSLGLWGPLPGSVANLSSLEILDMNSNYLSGEIPVQLSTLKSLQTLVLDNNNLTGRVPDWLSSLQVLAVTSLNNNSLTGPLPESIAQLKNLRILGLSGNSLSGEVPDLRNLTNLQVLDLEDNNLGLRFPTLPDKLVTIVLRRNKFHSGVPTEVGSFHQLRKFDVSLNGFVGPLPTSLLSLPAIAYLDVAGNKLTGLLLENMSCNAALVFVNLSSNLLTGALPSCLLNDSKRVVVYSRNCLSNGIQEQHPYPLCSNEALAVKISPREHRHRAAMAKAVLAFGILAGIVGGTLLLVLAFLVATRLYAQKTKKAPSTRFTKENASTANTAQLLTDARYIVQTMKLAPLALPAYRTFALEELKEATNSFDRSTLMSEGFHNQMYRGKLTDGTLVAIKSLKMSKRSGPHTYMQHIETMSKLRHVHLVSALGHCFVCSPDDSVVSGIYLIFEFIPNETLRGRISEGPPVQKLNWTQRIAAAIGVTKGIQFLHTGIVPGIFSNNIKITDVLLDHDLHVKICRYNLPLFDDNIGTVCAKVFSPGLKESITVREKQREKNDVYDIGTILLEIIVGRPVVSQNEVFVTKELIQEGILADDAARRSIVDPEVSKECSEESLKTVMEICARCLSNKTADRPTVDDVLWNLQFAAQVQESSKGDL